MTQLIVTSQNGRRLNSLRSLNLNLSSSESYAETPSFFSAQASIHTSSIAVIREKMQMKKPTSSAVPML